MLTPGRPDFRAGTNDLGLGINAWFVEDASTGLYTTQFYWQQPTTGQLSAASTYGWSLSTTLRVVEESEGVSESLFARFRDGTTSWEMAFDMQADADPVVQLYTSGGTDPSYALEGVGSTYHTYSLVYDPAAGSADLFVDGVERISDYEGWLYSATHVAWGTGGSNATGRGHFSSVQWDVVPEPSSLVMLISGALAVLWWRRKKA